MDQLSRVKDLPVPEFGTLQAWEVRASAAGRAANGDSSNDPSRSSHGLGYGGTTLPFVGDTKVDLILISFLFLVHELCGFYWSNKIFLVS
jgi:transcription initiation factor TFIIE subunit alpha